jgi:hypothetical protein
MPDERNISIKAAKGRPLLTWLSKKLLRRAVATHAWADLNPDRLKYEMIFNSGDEVGYGQLRNVRKIIESMGLSTKLRHLHV